LQQLFGTHPWNMEKLCKFLFQCLYKLEQLWQLWE
jgi:hypothetical protein